MFVWEQEACDPDDLLETTLPLIAQGECVEFTVMPGGGNHAVRVKFRHLSNLIKWIEGNYNYSEGICLDDLEKLLSIYGIKEEV